MTGETPGVSGSSGSSIVSARFPKAASRKSLPGWVRAPSEPGETQRYAVLGRFRYRFPLQFFALRSSSKGQFLPTSAAGVPAISRGRSALYFMRLLGNRSYPPTIPGRICLSHRDASMENLGLRGGGGIVLLAEDPLA